MALVMIVISLLIYAGYKYYMESIEDSKYSLIKFQSATFSRTVLNLYGQAKVLDKTEVQLNGAIIYFNELGWPASANRISSVTSYDQSPEECQRLWQGIFNNPPRTVIAGSEEDRDENVHKDFRISSINGRICRYELVRKQEGRYFFDYDLSTGEVKVFSPENS